LTVSFPCIPVEQIKGVKTVKRAGILLEFEMKKSETDERKPNLETWQIIKPKPVKDILTNSDASLYYQNYIVIVPMVADEIDYDLLEELEKSNKIPKWKID